MNKNCEAFTRHKYFAVTLVEKTEINNLCHAAPGPVMSQLSSSRKPAHVRILNHSVYTKHTWLNLIVSTPLCTYVNFIKLGRLYTTNK